VFSLGFLLSVFPRFFNGFESIAFAKGMVLAVFVGFFWFSLQYLIGLMTFWLEETWVLAVIAETIIQLLSGNIIPLDLFPEWAATMLSYTPFPYVTFIPVKTFMGAGGGFLTAIANIVFWTAMLNALILFVWKKGLKLYTGAGM
jgi:ABC-2 type transport system permease protein